VCIERIIKLDPEVEPVEETDKWVTLLLSDLEEMRKSRDDIRIPAHEC